MPLRSFFTFRNGPRAGKPFSRCSACCRVQKKRHVNSGLVLVDKVFYIFAEIEARIGRAEAVRRLGMSPNLWWRLDNRIYIRMEKNTVAKAMLLLRELRATKEVRHRDSIKYGASARGQPEKKVRTRQDLYRHKGQEERDVDAKRKRDERANMTPSKRQEYLRRDRERRKNLRAAKKTQS